MNLPEEFCNNMRSLLGDKYDLYISSYNEEALSGLRVNRNKISVEDFIKIAPFKIEKIPYIDNGFYINENDPWTKHPYYYGGLYYIQEPSAMLPANRLPVKEKGCVLDLCAAPGGKASELITKGAGLLVANDISFSRTIPLVKNLEIQGADQFYVTCEDPAKLLIDFPSYFDSILVDAPCSGEGMFRKDGNLIKSWLTRKPEEYGPLQREILDSAIGMLKEDGYLLYSTCTFSPIEDEENIIYLLDKYSNLELMEISPVEGAISGYKRYTDGNQELEKCIHIIPPFVKGEGHFLALLHKKPTLGYESDKYEHDKETVFNPAIKSRKNKKIYSFNSLPDSVRDFMNNLKGQAAKKAQMSTYLLGDKGMLTMLPLGFEDVYFSDLHYSRTGVLVGECDQRGNFKPHTAFALSIRPEDFNNCCDFSSSDINVYKYLKGETIICDSSFNELNKLEKGYVYISVDGFGLGFAKSDGSKLKNLYEKGWRMN